MKKLFAILNMLFLLSACSKPELSNLQKVTIEKGDKKSLSFVQLYTEIPVSETHPYRVFFEKNNAGGFDFSYNFGAYNEPVTETTILRDLATAKKGQVTGAVKSATGAFVPQQLVAFQNIEIQQTPFGGYNSLISDVSAWLKKTIRIKGRDDKGAEYSADLYCPERIALFNSYSIPLGKEKSNEIKWNKDELNTNGVVLVMEYPTSTGREVDGFLLIDDGCFILPSDYIKKIPSGTNVTISLWRGNAAIAQGAGTTKPTITLTTTVTATFKVK